MFFFSLIGMMGTISLKLLIYVLQYQNFQGGTSVSFGGPQICGSIPVHEPSGDSGRGLQAEHVQDQQQLM